MDGTPITTCSGYFFDSGGPSAVYSSNQDLTTTICPDALNSKIQLNFENVRIRSSDTLFLFDGEDIDSPLLKIWTNAYNTFDAFTASNPSGCITARFKSNNSLVSEGWVAQINCLFLCQPIHANITEPNEPVQVCINETINFSATGLYPENDTYYHQSDENSSFKWFLGNGQTAFGSEITYQYKKSGTYFISLFITDDNQCTSPPVHLTVEVSTRPNFIMNEALDMPICTNDTLEADFTLNEIDLNKDISVIPTTSLFNGNYEDTIVIPDAVGLNIELDMPLYYFPENQTLDNLEDLKKISINMEHSWMRDLEIKIICPNGSTAILHNHPGLFGSGVYVGDPVAGDPTNPVEGVGYEYTWTNDADLTWIEWGNINDGPGAETLPAGNYRAYDDLSVLLGCPLNGDWTLVVEDLWAQDNGFVFGWDILFSPEFYSDDLTFTPNLVEGEWYSLYDEVIYNNTDSIALITGNAGSTILNLSVTDDFGCSYDTSLIRDILPELHPDCHTCSDDISFIEDTIICASADIVLNSSSPSYYEQATVFEIFPNYVFGNSNHPPSNPYYSDITVNSIQPLVINGPLTDIVSVCVDIETDFISDVSIFLKSPNGTILVLSTHNGGSGQYYTNTCFTPLATTSITASSSPFTGDFLPEGSWDDLIGSTINGTWSLIVMDAFAPFSFGTLNDWSITFNSPIEVSYDWSPSTGLSCNDCPSPDISIDTSITYTVEVSDNFGCFLTDTINISTENRAPSITNCPEMEIVNLDDNCEFIVPDYSSQATFFDNCSFSIHQFPAIGTILTEEGEQNITLQIDDGFQQEECTFPIKLVDNTPPVLACVNKMFVTEDELRNRELTLARELEDFINMSASFDACGHDLLFEGFTFIDTPDSDTGTGLVTVSDGRGNFATCELGLTTLPIALSLDWLRFDARLTEANQVELSWHVFTTHPVDFFTIERSQDGELFEPLEKINAPHPTHQENTYFYLDKTSLSPHNYYRIKQTGTDKKESWSPVKFIQNLAVQQFLVSPNPATEHLEIRVSNWQNTPFILCIFDINGKKIYAKEMIQNPIHIDLREINMPAGIYFVQAILPEQRVWTSKLVKE